MRVVIMLKMFFYHLTWLIAEEDFTAVPHGSSMLDSFSDSPNLLSYKYVMVSSLCKVEDSG
jgi:hypothetical protein